MIRKRKKTLLHSATHPPESSSYHPPEQRKVVLRFGTQNAPIYRLKCAFKCVCDSVHKDACVRHRYLFPFKALDFKTGIQTVCSEIQREGKRSHVGFTLVWIPPHSQGLNAQMDLSSLTSLSWHHRKQAPGSVYSIHPWQTLLWSGLR